MIFKTSAELLALSEKSLRAAERSQDPEVRAAFLELAEEWRKMSELADAQERAFQGRDYAGPGGAD